MRREERSVEAMSTNDRRERSSASGMLGIYVTVIDSNDSDVESAEQKC